MLRPEQQRRVPRGVCGGGHPTGRPVPATVRLTYRDRDDNLLAVEDVCQRCADGIAKPWASQSKPLIHR
jgi:hypothetical protein